MARGTSRASSEFADALAAVREERAARTRDESYYKANIRDAERKLVDLERELQTRGYVRPDRAGGVAWAADKLIREADAETLGKLTKLMSAIYDYQGDKHFEKQGDSPVGHRERRQAIATAFKELPDWLKTQFSVTGDIMGILKRGGDQVAGKPSYTEAGPDGTTNVSFSSDPDWARFFADSSRARPKPEGAKPYLFDKKDVASFGDVIDLNAVGLFRRRIYEYADNQAKLESARLNGRESKKVTALKDFMIGLNAAGGDFSGASVQDEYFVTDVKWKRDA